MWGPSSCLKVREVGGGGGLQDFSVSPRPFGFVFETKGLRPGLDKFLWDTCITQPLQCFFAKSPEVAMYIKA